MSLEFVETICESCKTRLFAVVTGTELPDTYKICNPCRERLNNRALRPLELFNLVAIHGHYYDLHDDFYDYHNGKATQPNVDVEDPELYPFPILEEVRKNLHDLIDFACVEYFTSQKTYDYIKLFDKEEVLDYLKFKVNYNREINYKCYEIAANILHNYAGDWIRDEWKGRKLNELGIFAQALAACLPIDEAFETITLELEPLLGSHLSEGSWALYYLNSNKTLGWIEKVKNKIINIPSGWGALAAQSQFNWETAERWLNMGRPLSLIALDALDYCTGIPHASWPIQLQRNPPVLFDRPESSMIVTVVNKYIEIDNARRPRLLGLQIIKNLTDSANL